MPIVRVSPLRDDGEHLKSAGCSILGSTRQSPELLSAQAADDQYWP